MSYKIRYCADVHYSGESRTGKFLIIRIIVVGICAIMVAVLGRDQITDWIIPGDNTVTEVAFSEFKHALNEGASFGDAFEVFCREIIYSDADT